MTDLDDLNDPRFIVYRIDDSVGTLADSVALLAASKLLAPWRTRNCVEALNSSHDPRADSSRLDRPEFLGSRRLDEDAIACHAAGEP